MSKNTLKNYGSILWEHQPSMNRSRFNLLLLEHGEYYFRDFSAVWYRFKSGSYVKINGRLKCCSRSLLFEPTDDAMIEEPILRFPFKTMGQITKHTKNFSEIIDNIDTLFTFLSSSLYEMKADDIPAPYIYKQCGTENNGIVADGPQFVFGLVHTGLDEFLGIVQVLWDIVQKCNERGPGRMCEEELLKPFVDEIYKQATTFETIHLVNFNEH